MKARARRRTWLWMSVAAAVLGAGTAQGTREAMGRIFESMRVLLPLAASDERFRDPDRAEEIQQALDAVASSASSVAEHTAAGDRGARFLGRALDMEARQAASLFAFGASEAAQFTVLQMTEYCVECHSRRPVPEDSPLAAGFVSEATFADLDLETRARLQFATRQFDAGLATLEQLIASPEVPAPQLLGAVTNYLVVSLRVRQDFERPVPVLEGLAARPDLWTYLRLDVEHWIEMLPKLAPRSRSDRLEDAVALLDEARQTIRFPSDRQALIHYIAATMILSRVVESETRSRAERARAYYLMGVAESRIGRTYWLALPDFYLDSAIRLDPGGQSALEAYALLEENTVFLYSESPDEITPNLPLDVERGLEELRTLIESAKAPAAEP